MEARFSQTDQRIDSSDAKVSRHFVWLVGILVTSVIAILGVLGGRQQRAITVRSAAQPAPTLMHVESPVHRTPLARAAFRQARLRAASYPSSAPSGGSACLPSTFLNPQIAIAGTMATGIRPRQKNQRVASSASHARLRASRPSLQLDAAFQSDPGSGSGAA